MLLIFPDLALSTCIPLVLNQDRIIESFTNPLSPLRIVISTTAFEMGIDCPDVCSIIHCVPPKDIESYVHRLAGQDMIKNSHMQSFYITNHDIQSKTECSSIVLMLMFVVVLFYLMNLVTKIMKVLIHYVLAVTYAL